MKYKILLSALLVSVQLNAGELEDKLDALIEEVESLKSSKTDTKLSSYTGLGVAASRIYTQDEKLSIGGYGHTDYVNSLNQKSAELDNYRAIMYMGYKFSDNIIFQSEIEFEHVNQLAVEFAAIDFLVNKELNFRAGNFIVPVGHVNLQHEPTLFMNVSRPETERQIIPSTFHENGVMVYGTFGNIQYQFAAINSLDGNNSSVRSMRQSASNAVANDFAYVGRLTYKPINGLQITTSALTGQIDQGIASLNGATLTMAEAHVLYNANKIRFVALYAANFIGGADKITAENGTETASQSSGFYTTLGYQIGKWTPFIHVESYNESLKNSAGVATTGQDVNWQGIGINYNPHAQVVIKADYMKVDDKGTSDDRLSMGIGYIF